MAQGGATLPVPRLPFRVLDEANATVVLVLAAVPHLLLPAGASAGTQPGLLQADPAVCAAATTAAAVQLRGRPLAHGRPSLWVGGREEELGLFILQGWFGTAKATVRAAV